MHVHHGHLGLFFTCWSVFLSRDIRFFKSLKKQTWDCTPTKIMLHSWRLTFEKEERLRQCLLRMLFQRKAGQLPACVLVVIPLIMTVRETIWSDMPRQLRFLLYLPAFESTYFPRRCSYPGPSWNINSLRNNKTTFFSPLPSLSHRLFKRVTM